MSSNEHLVLLGLSAVVLITLAVWIISRFRTTPEQRERRRRLEVNREGRMGDAMVTDVQEKVLYSL